MKITELFPTLIWHYFDALTAIPRPSGGENRVVEWLIGVAEGVGLEWHKDATGNLRISAPATAGREEQPIITLQAHLDMVCEKRVDSPHDFMTDPIETYIEDGWVRARGTTLGADCGIGVAAALAALTDPDYPHGRIDALFTLDEERGLTGAFGLGDEMIRGEQLINLDSEDEGEIFIGCAGGIDTVAQFRYGRQSVATEGVTVRITVGGLLGGHSGDDINKGRANAVKIVARMVSECGGELIAMECGNLRNAIPRDGWAVVVIDDMERFTVQFDSVKRAILDNILELEPNATIEFESITTSLPPLDEASQRSLLSALNGVVNGVMAMSREMEGLVETSSNLASVRMFDDVIEVVTSQRSSSTVGRTMAMNLVSSAFEAAGATVVHSDGYPGWTPRLDSPLLEVARRCYRELFGCEPKVRAIHAGLECGLFLEQNPRLDMISFGPTIVGVHSPDERLDITSVERFWLHLKRVIESV